MPSRIRRRLLGTAAATVIGLAPFGLAEAAAAPTSNQPARSASLIGDRLSVQGPNAEGEGGGYRHTFTKEETQQIFDAGKSGGKTAAYLACIGFGGPQAAPLCGPGSELVVEAIAKNFEPKGRCLQIWAFTNDTPPIGGKYVECSE